MKYDAVTAISPNWMMRRARNHADNDDMRFCSHPKSANHAAMVLGIVALFGASVRAEPPARTKKQFVLVTELHVAAKPANACEGACAQAAAAEREKVGPPVSWPLYRRSPTEYKAGVDRFFGKDSKEAQRFTHEEVMDLWNRSYPDGSFNPNDLADVFAKYWLFAWISAGADLHAVTEKARSGVRAQAHNILAADPVFSGLSEAQREVAAESMIRNQVGLYIALMALAPHGKARPQVLCQGHGVDYKPIRARLRIGPAQARTDPGAGVCDPV